VALSPEAAVETGLYDAEKIDCHCHVLDPARFPYGEDTFYRPSGQEIGCAEQLSQMHDAYGVRYGLIVGPNSGYEQDNRCLLAAIERGAGRYKGIAVVANDTGRDELFALRARGIVGVAFNATHHGVDHYRDTEALLADLRALDMCVSLQVRDEQLVALAPLLERSGVRLLIDHCGRPSPEAGLDQPGFRELLRLGRAGRAFVKLSGYAKISRGRHPYDDMLPYVAALLDAFTPDGCLWASDWPFLRASERIDVGPLLVLAQRFVPDPRDRRKVFWDTPRRVLGFG
jgi:predicted TIM-barrel fold metal-dependent hydrolase